MPTATCSKSIGLLLTVEAAAAELGCMPIHVLRLIHRNVLPATMLGDQWRITADNLVGYVAKGAKDFNAPAIRGDWFADPEAELAKQVVAAIREAVEPSLLDKESAVAAWQDNEAVLKSEGAASPNYRSHIVIELIRTAYVESVLAALKNSRDLWSAYCVHRLRKAVHLKATFESKVKPLARLYSAEYHSLVQAGIAQVQAENCLEFQTQFPLPEPTADDSKLPQQFQVAKGDEVEFFAASAPLGTIHYRLSHCTLGNCNWERIVQLAF